MAGVSRDPGEVRREADAVDSGWALKHGIIGGIIAGIVFAMAEMLAAWVTQGNPFGPLHMIASIPLQQQPMQIPQGTAIAVGILFHMVTSMVYGGVVAYVVASVPALHSSPTATIVFATLFGFILWPLNFYVIAPNIGVPWFATQTAPVQQFLWHTFAFGTVLGFYLASQLPET